MIVTGYSRALLMAGAAILATAAQAQVQNPATAADTAQSGGEAQSATPLETTRTDQGSIIVTAAHYVPAGSMTANKTSIPLIQTPQSISVVTRDQIDLLNFIDAQQAVRYVAGVTGENYGPDPRYDFVTVRGFVPKQYIDGLAVPATTTIAATGVDLYAFQSLDVLKGPASTLYGAAPPGGVLNETSRRPSSDTGGELLAKYGSHGFGEIATTFTGPAAPFLDVRMTALLRDADGEIDHQHSKRALAAPSATLKLGDRTRITGLFYYQYDKVEGGAGGFLPIVGTLLDNPNGRIKRSTNLDDPTDLFVRRQYGAGYDAEHRFGGAIVFHSNAKWSRYEESTPTGLYSGGGFTNTTDSTLPSYDRTLQQYNFSYEERVSSFAIDNRLDATIATGPLRHRLLVGLDYRNVRNLAAQNFLFAGTIDAFDPVYDRSFEQNIGFPNRYNQQRLKQTGAYGQDQIQLGRLYVTGGVRYDWVRTRSAESAVYPDLVTTPPSYVPQKQHKLTYRVGANYVTDAGIAPYVSYATSFEPILGVDSVTGAPFRPSSTHQIEGGVKFDARGLGPDIKLFATVAGFDIKESNFTSPQLGITPAFVTQGGTVEVYGAEAELVARIHQQLTLNASASYNHSEVRSSASEPADVGLPLPTTPRYKLAGLVDYTLQKGPLGGLGAGLGARYNSRSTGALPGLFATPVIYAGRATLFDALVHYDLPGWRFALNGSNIFDKRYVARCAGTYGCVYGAGQRIIGTVTKKF